MIRIRGTSHVAREDLESIRQEVEGEQPGVVALELDPKRLEALLHGNPGRGSLNPFLTLLQKVQELLGRYTGVAPGSDMREAFRAAEAEGIDVALVDQDIGITIRNLKETPLAEKIKFAGFLIVSPFLFHGTGVDLKKVPGQELVEEMLLRFRIGFPGMFRVLVEERNDVMAERLKALEEEYGHVLAFVGAGHVSGLRKRLEAS